jgi:hypothetical protein
MNLLKKPMKTSNKLLLIGASLFMLLLIVGNILLKYYLLK